MMDTRIRQVALLSGLWLACGITFAGAMDLQQAVTLAVQSHPRIAAAVANLAQRAGAEDVARAGYRPQVRAGIDAGRQLGQANGRQLTLNASQMLYDFGKVSGAVNQAEANTRQQFAEVLAQVDDVVRDTALTLVEVHRFQQLEAQSQALVEALNDIVRLTEMRASAGAATQADPISARARLGAAQSAQLAAHSQLGQQRSKLSILTHAPLPVRMEAPNAAELQRWSQGPYPDLASLPAVQSAQADMEANQAALAKTKAEQMPTLSLQAGVSKPLRGPDPAYGRDHSLMLTVSGMLYQGGALQAQAKAAAFGVEAARARIASTRLEWQQRQEQLREQANGLQQRVRLQAARQQALQASRPLYREQYLTLGTRSVLDLLNNEQEIFQAMADQVNAEHDLWTTELDIVYATGRLRQVFDLQHIQGVDLNP